MAVITIPRKTFEREIGKLNEQMQNKIGMFGTPIEKLDKDELQIEIFPNRPDLLSYHGFKRAFLSFLGKNTGLKKYKINKPKKEHMIKIDSSVKKVRPYTSCAIVKGLKLNDEKIKEIIEAQEKLHITLGRKRKRIAIGIYPLEKIKMPIIFKALEPDKIKFVPLESQKEMSGLQILQRHPTGKEYAHLLSGKEKFPIFVDSENKILSMPPIINSQITGRITEKTKNVFVECSGYDFSVLSKCLNIIVTILAEMGGKIHQITIKDKGAKKISPNLTPEKMKPDLKRINKLLGLNLNEKELKKLFEKMGYNYDKKNVKIPPWRADILHEVDLIEDVAIAYGYENFIPELPEISTIGEENSKEIIKKKISEILTGLEMLEVSNYHLTNKKDQFIKMGINKKKDFIEVESSKTDFTILRENLSHYLLKNLSENIDSEYPQKIFEIGKIFSLEKNEIKENEHLASAIAPSDYTKIRQVLEYLFKMIDMKIKFKESESENLPKHFIEGRTAEIILDDKRIGFVGEMHPRTLKAWKMKMPIALFEISLEEIFNKLEN